MEFCRSLPGLHQDSMWTSPSTVQFQSIHHSYVTVTHLMKFLFHHFGWRAVTMAKFHQIGQLTTKLLYLGVCDTNLLSGSQVTCDRDQILFCQLSL
jgi:hypothetical protein